MLLKRKTTHRRGTASRWIKVKEKDWRLCSSSSIPHLSERLRACNSGSPFSDRCKPRILPKALYPASVSIPLYIQPSRKILKGPNKPLQMRIISLKKCTHCSIRTSILWQFSPYTDWQLLPWLWPTLSGTAQWQHLAHLLLPGPHQITFEMITKYSRHITLLDHCIFLLVQLVLAHYLHSQWCSRTVLPKSRPTKHKVTKAQLQPLALLPAPDTKSSYRSIQLIPSFPCSLCCWLHHTPRLGKSLQSLSNLRSLQDSRFLQI